MTTESAIREAARAAQSGDYDVQRRLTSAYGHALKDVAEAQTALVNEMVRRQNAGEPVSPSWFNQNRRYLSLQSQYYGALRTFGLSADSIVHKYIPERVGYLLEGTRGEIRSQGVEAPDYDSRVWSVINKEAYAAAVGILEHDKSPFRAIFERDFPETGLAEFRKVWTRGILLGQNPRRIAGFAAKRVAGLTLGRAQLMARTEFHRAYREGKLEQFQRSRVVEGWVWRAALDRRTCAVCWGMHGSVFPVTQPMESHPACRCVMIPQTDGPLAPKLEDGESIFGRLPADQQLRILGPSRFKMHQAGTPLQSMITERHSGLWGTIRSLETLPRTRRVVRKPGPPDEDLYANPFRSATKRSEAGNYNELSEASNRWGDSWGVLSASTPQTSALRYYQGSGYMDINGYLRRGSFSPVASKNVDLIDEVMDASRTGTAAVVYRGTTESAFGLPRGATFEQIKATVGTTITDKGYFSSATFNPFGKDIQLEVLVPKGTKAVWMSQKNLGSSGIDNPENELLLDRGTKMLVEKVEKKSGRTDIYGNPKDEIVVTVRVVGQDRNL